MPKLITEEQMQEAVNAVATSQGNIASAARELGMSRSTLKGRYLKAIKRGIEPTVNVSVTRDQLESSIIDLLKRKPRGRTPGYTIDELCDKLNRGGNELKAIIESMRDRGINIENINDKYAITKETDPTYDFGSDHAYISGKDNTFTFGFTSDNHLGSKYERLDVLNDLYDKFVEAKVDRVFNAGNWIDGEARFNKFDLHTHGMDAQIQYLVDNYPKRDGIRTYAVAGDDHEGWYGQREGVDIGRYAYNRMRDDGRDDWIYLGYMESYIPLVNVNTGKASQLLLMHPGGGTSYAISYTAQKIVESFEGGEKPAVVLFGHYHKMNYGLIRNVWAIQTGCTQDQTPFMRKKKIPAHIGGGICKLTQDPTTSAIIRCQVEYIQYFNKGYYNNRWNLAGSNVLPRRTMSGV